jgi:hypothetical protein
MSQGRESQQFLGDVFGRGSIFGESTPGTGLTGAGLEQIFGPFGQQPGPLQQQAVGNISTLLGQPSPEMQAWQLAQQGLNPLITGQGQFGNIDAAMQPIFQRNLGETLAQTQATLPSVFNRASANEVANVGQRALQDYNLFIQQARQQDIENRIQAALASGTLSSAAGQQPFQRNLQAGMFGQQADMFRAQQMQAMQQAILQLLGIQMGGQYQVQAAEAGNRGGGLGGFLGGALGTAAGFIPGI